MFKSPIILIAAFLLAGCEQPTLKFAGNVDQQANDTVRERAAVNEDKLIIPGKGVGEVTINSNLENTLKVLGKPDREDAAMGAAFMSWYDQHNPNGHQFQVYAHRNMGNADEAISRVKKIRITSPDYKTKDQIHTGLTLTEIKKQYDLTPSPNPPFKDRGKMYHDLEKGISFEFKPDSTCMAIVIHAPGDNSLTYINLK